MGYKMSWIGQHSVSIIHIIADDWWLCYDIYDS